MSQSKSKSHLRPTSYYIPTFVLLFWKIFRTPDTCRPRERERANFLRHDTRTLDGVLLTDTVIDFFPFQQMKKASFKLLLFAKKVKFMPPLFQNLLSRQRQKLHSKYRKFPREKSETTDTHIRDTEKSEGQWESLLLFHPQIRIIPETCSHVLPHTHKHTHTHAHTHTHTPSCTCHAQIASCSRPLCGCLRSRWCSLLPESKRPRQPHQSGVSFPACEWHNNNTKSVNVCPPPPFFFSLSLSL